METESSTARRCGKFSSVWNLAGSKGLNSARLAHSNVIRKEAGRRTERFERRDAPAPRGASLGCGRPCSSRRGVLPWRQSLVTFGVIESGPEPLARNRRLRGRDVRRASSEPIVG